MDWFGIRILGANEETLFKVILTAVVLAVAFGVRALIRVTRRIRPSPATRRSIWTRKTLRLAIGLFTLLLVVSIWFDEPGNLAIFGGIVAGGLAFASQNAILSVAGYFVIVFGKVFDIGQRIELGGVRGDVLDIGLFKTTIMEMGVPASLIPDPNHWVAARQYTGRVVTVVNAEVFRQPVFNYTSPFDLLWEEIRVPVRYGTDVERAERVLLSAADRHTRELVDQGKRLLHELREAYVLQPSDLEPRVYVRLTDNWIELTVRFVTRSFGVRDLRDGVSRDVLAGLQREGIEVASSTIEVARLPPLRIPGSQPDA